MAMETIADEVKELHQKLTGCLNTVKLEVAGRFVYYDKENRLFILAVHATSPEKAQEAGDIALDAIRYTIFPELREAGIGFACRLI